MDNVIADDAVGFNGPDFVTRTVTVPIDDFDFETVGVVVRFLLLRMEREREVVNVAER